MLLQFVEDSGGRCGGSVKKGRPQKEKRVDCCATHGGWVERDDAEEARQEV